MSEVSVILPVYNIKRDYLVKAVKSILAQSFTDFELLIIDDGSKKDTADVCDELAAEDPRIKVFHNKNQGPGKSRNFGLSQAQGNFIIFADHDDWVEAEWLKKLYSSITENNADAAFCYADEYFEDDNVFKPIPYPHFDAEVILMDEMYRAKLANAFFPPWAKMVRADFIRRYDLKFAEDDNRFDDVLFHVFLNEYAQKVSFVDEILYHHRMFANSITVTSFTNTDMYFDVFKTIESVIAKCAVDGSNPRTILNRNINFFCSANDIIKSRKEFIKRMSGYIKQLGLEDIIRKQRRKKIKQWFFTINRKKGILRILGITLMNRQKKA